MATDAPRFPLPESSADDVPAAAPARRRRARGDGPAGTLAVLELSRRLGCVARLLATGLPRPRR